MESRILMRNRCTKTALLIGAVMPQYSLRAQCCRNEKETHSIDSFIAVNADIPERKCMSSWIMEERCSSFLIKVAVQAAGQECNAGALMLHPFC